MRPTKNADGPRLLTLLVLTAGGSLLLLAALNSNVFGLPIGRLLDPADGLYRTARLADALPTEVRIPGLQGPVDVVWDERRVPHVFARHDLDAVAVLGYVIAHDRLFQLDFIPRAAAGRLSEALGPPALLADRFLRRTGMEWGARRNLARVLDQEEELEVLEAYCRGVNAYVDGLREKDLPLEFRVLGYRPDRCTPLQTLRLLQYMNYDLSYPTDEPSYGWIRERLSEEDYGQLFPAEQELYVPIIPPEASTSIDDRFEGFKSRPDVASPGPRPTLGAVSHTARPEPSLRRNERGFAGTPARAGPGVIGFMSDLGRFPFETSRMLEGFLPGKGSNNWAVDGSRAATGAPILAGDIHLRLTLPSLWYEAHLVTPTINTYGVTIPGAPVPVAAFNDVLGWTFTNTGADQLDHYLLEVDEGGTRYWYEGAWCDLELRVDTIFVRGAEPVLDTLRFAHWGPVVEIGGRDVAVRWVAHDSSRTLSALLGMNRARNHDEFQAALRFWDTPMQNVLYADAEGIISIRSTGYLPIRRAGHGSGLLDGTTNAFEWVGRVPFDELPYAARPAQGFLTSTNQKPADATYPYYLGHDWREGYRSLRIDELLRGQERHRVEDLKRYQADVHAVQRDLFVPMLDTLSAVSDRADELRRLLLAWDGEMAVDRHEPHAFDVYLTELRRLAWDDPVFEPVITMGEDGTITGVVYPPRPREVQLYRLLVESPTSEWLNVAGTDRREHAGDLLRAALEAAAARLERETGWDMDAWRWGLHRRLRINHVIDSPALEALGRGPFEFPGYRKTLSPAEDSLTTKSATWRMVVDFSTTPPSAFGVYPGGQSGNPFSRYYDLHVPAYLGFEYYELLTPESPESLPESHVLHRAAFQAALE